MLRHRLVRQSAVNVNSSSESSSMPSPPPLRKRRNSQDSTLYRQLSSDSLDSLISSSPSQNNEGGRRGGGRRHSVACSVLYMDMPKPTLKSAFNSAVRRMSDACSMLSSAPSSTYNLSPTQTQFTKKKENEVMLPQVMGTFRESFKPPTKDKNSRNNFQVNRRFSTDCPPPSYTEATSGWKQTSNTRQKLLTRQHEVVNAKACLVDVEDDDSGNQEE